jgi:alpha-L-rhamnosidase
VGQGRNGVGLEPAGAVVGDLTWVKCHHDSPYGRIVSNWRRTAANFEMETTIPANTTATVYVPATGAEEITESGKPLDKVPGVKLLRMDNGHAVLAVESGAYRFASKVEGNQ